MRIKAYISFPENDNYFISVGGNILAYKEIIREVASIIYQLKKKSFELWYDSQNLVQFFAKIALVNNEPYLGNLNLQLKNYLDKKAQDVRTSPKSSGQFRYVVWNCQSNALDAPLIISEIIESELSKQVNDNCVFVNFRDSVPSERDSLFCIKDALHIPSLPMLIPIQVAASDIEFAEWYSSNTNQNFSIRNKAAFQVTAFMWEKQRIYKKISDGTFWYSDYFHKDNRVHFEVFDPTGKMHLGEANPDGVIDNTRADNNKKIDHRIK
jgi:hypothetical protein